MKRGRGIFGSVLDTFLILIAIGFLLAVLGNFNGDVFALFEWIGATIINFIYAVRDFFGNKEAFKSFFA